MSIVRPIQRITKTFEGYDCLFAPCKHDKQGQHGIHCEEMHLVVLTEISDGRHVALVLTLYTGKFPSTVPPSHLSTHPSIYPRAADLSLHVQAKIGHTCCWFGDRGFCQVPFTTALGASELFANASYAVLREAEQATADRWKANGEKPDDELWGRLEARLRKLVVDLEAGALDGSDS